MTKTLQNAVARLERALSLPEDVGVDHDEHAEQEWVAPEQALRSQLPLLRLYASWSPKPHWFDERRAEVERMFPAAGFWRKRPSPEEEMLTHRLCDEQLAKLRSSSPTIQVLDANPAYRAGLDAESRARLRRYLAPDDPLQPLLAQMEGANPPFGETADDLALRQLRSAVEIDLGPANYGIVEFDPPESERSPS